MTRRRSTARRAPARGGQQGYEPPVTRMRRDERILDLVVERWSQRQIAAEVGLTQGGVSKALRRILTRRQATLTQEGRSLSDQAGAAGGAAATTVVELDTQSAAGNPTYLAVEQRSDEFAAKLLGLYDRPALPAGALPPALDPTSANVRLLGDVSVSNSSSGRRWKLDHAPAVGDPTHMVEFGTGRRAFAREA